MNRENEIHQIFKEIGPLNYKAMYPKLEKIGFYPGQPIILEIIKNNPGISQRKLAVLTHKEPATITTMLNRMNKQGYINKEKDLNDKRIIRLSLTQRGRIAYKELNDVMEENSKTLFNNLSDEEKDMLYNILLKIKNNLENKQ